MRGSNPGEGEIFRTRPDRPWDPKSLLHNGYRVFPGGKSAGEWRYHLPHLAPKSKRESNAITLLHLWTFVACYRVNFTLIFTFTNPSLGYVPLFCDIIRRMSY